MLWKKAYSLDERILAFTVGNDPNLDTKIFYADIMASIAHVRGLATIGILDRSELKTLEDALRKLWEKKPLIKMEDEDCHTWIEARLVEQLGELGKKVHTGRSRNDQVLAATRLYSREMLLVIFEKAYAMLKVLHERAKEHVETPFPGRTHTQIAMPFSFGMLFDAWFEQYYDDVRFMQYAYAQINRSPLGSAAGYGVPLPLDREYVSDLLGFDAVQTNVLAVQNSRSRIEAIVLQALEQLSITSSRIAEELILYSLPEFGYTSLPKELCTGSSIMPQKHNPDVLELIRASALRMHSFAERIALLSVGRISGYHRDMQETKQALLEGLDSSDAILAMMHIVLERLIVHVDALEKTLSPELFATDAAFSKVLDGMPFRDAYREVAKDPRRHGSEISYTDSTKLRRSTGTHGNPPWELRMNQLDALQTWTQEAIGVHRTACTAILGRDWIMPEQ